jgi:hypothetical protein
MFLVIVDAFTKWPEVIPTDTSTATKTIQLLNDVFGRFGYPQILVTDNGTQFTSLQMVDFCTSNGILHLRSAPYHPQSNGQAEIFVGTFKNALRKIGGGNTEEAINEFLRAYRSSPNKNTPNNSSPAELMFGRKIRNNLELLLPSQQVDFAVNEQQNEQFNKRHGARKRVYSPDDSVKVQIHKGNSCTWSVGTVIEKIGTVMYNVLLDETGKLIRCHANQMQAYHPADRVNQSQPTTKRQPLFDAFGIYDKVDPTPADQTATTTTSTGSSEESNTLEDTVVTPPQPRGDPQAASTPIHDRTVVHPANQQTSRYGRNYRRPLRYDDYQMGRP